MRRLAFGRKLYRCQACDAVMLLEPTDVWLRRDIERLSQQDTLPGELPGTVLARYRPEPAWASDRSGFPFAVAVAGVIGMLLML